MASKRALRPSPSASATDYPNQVKTGNDGRKYVATPDKNGDFTWKVWKAGDASPKGADPATKAKALAAVKKNWKNFKAYAAFRNDVDVMLEATRRSRGTWKVAHFAGSAVRADRTFILAAAKFDRHALCMASKPLQDDLPLALALAAMRGQRVAPYVSKRLLDEATFIFAASKTDREAFSYAGPRLSNDRAFVWKALKTEKTMGFVGDKLMKDPQFIVEATKKWGPRALSFVSEKLADNKKLVLAVVAADPAALKYASARLKKDEDVRAAAKK